MIYFASDLVVMVKSVMSDFFMCFGHKVRKLHRKQLVFVTYDPIVLANDV